MKGGAAAAPVEGLGRFCEGREGSGKGLRAQSIEREAWYEKKREERQIRLVWAPPKELRGSLPLARSAPPLATAAGPAASRGGFF